MRVRDVLSVLTGAGAPDARSWSSTSLAGMGLGQGRWAATSGRTVPATEATIDQLSAVWACRDLLVRHVASLPVDVYRVRTGSSERGQQIDPPLVVASPSPEPTIDQMTWVGQVVEAIIMRGNVVGVVTEFESSGWPRRISLEHPDELQLSTVRGRNQWWLCGREVTPWQVGGSLWHVPVRPAPGKLLGRSVLTAARRSIELGLTATQFGAEYFAAPAPTAVVSVDAPLVEGQADDIKRRIVDSQLERSPIVLGRPATGGQVTGYQQLTITPEESQFLATIGANAADIARYFGVPPKKINAPSNDSLTYANVEQDQISYLVDTMLPLVALVERVWTALIPRGQVVKLNFGGLLRADAKAQSETWALGIDNGWLVPNEVRAWLDLPPIEGGDVVRPPRQKGGSNVPASA